MGAFEYKGFSSAGKPVAGVIEASSEGLAFEQLSSDGITPTLLQAAREAAANATARRPEAQTVVHGNPRGRINAQRRTQVMQELSTLLMAGVPLLEALHVMRAQETHAAMHAVLEDLATMVQRGEPFSRALAGHPKLFPHLVVTMARVGETGGQLGEMLERMAGWMEYQDGLRAEVRGALIYPCIVLALGAVSVTVLVTFVLPRIRPIFEGMGDLPLPTKIMLGASDWMQHYWWTIPLALLVAFVIGRQTIKSGEGRRLLDRLVLRLPIAGALILHSELARFASSCASLLTSGVPLLETLKVVRGLVGNSELAAMVGRATEQVTHGQALARALSDSPWFPQTALHLLAVGEKSGRLPDMFERLAVRFEKATRRRLKTMIDMIAPLMIVFLAVLVGGIALSILLPIYRMNQMMH